MKPNNKNTVRHNKKIPAQQKQLVVNKYPSKDGRYFYAERFQYLDYVEWSVMIEMPDGTTGQYDKTPFVNFKDADELAQQYANNPDYNPYEL